MHNGPSHTEQSAPILIVHLDSATLCMMQAVFALDGYTAQATSRGDEALQILRAAAGGMIVYVEPLLLRVRGNERLHDSILGRGSDNPHAFIHLAGMVSIESNWGILREDGYLAIPFTVSQVIASIDEVQRHLQAKRA